MGQKYRHLIEQIAEIDNLRLAYRRARENKRLTYGCLFFKEHLESNLAAIQKAFQDGTYKCGDYTIFTIYEPKKREIMALPFYDRVVQHALCNIIGPIFDSVLMPRTYACRVGKGTHRAVKECQAELRRVMRERGDAYFLKIDFSKYFASIDRRLLWQEIERKISCKATLKLIEAILPRDGKGLPIGNLTSQLFANLYGHKLDRWLVHEKGVLTAFRYMDDTVIIHHDLEYLQALWVELSAFVRGEMQLEFSKWSIQHYTKGINFVGYRIWPQYKLLRRDSVVRAKRKIRFYRKTAQLQKLASFLASWLGHAGWANTRNLLQKLEVAPS